MTGQKLMGIDLGTSSIKTIIMDASGRVEAAAAREYPIHIPQPGFAEQDPEDWYLGAVQTIRQVLAESGINPAQVSGIGLSGQMHGLVCLDKSGNVLRPAIIWADQRSAVQVKKVYDLVGTDRISQWTGNPLATGFMLPSWLWILDNEPEIAAKTAHILLPKDYLRFRLTGLIGSEASDASSTSIFDINHRDWCRPLLDLVQINSDLLPEIHPSEQVCSGLTDTTAQDTGLPFGTPVIFGGADQAMQAIGRGVIDPGVLSCAISTGGQLVTPVARPQHDPQLRIHCMCHALPDMWYMMAATLSAGLSLRWLRDNIIKSMNYQQIADLAAESSDTQELLFLPHLVGERTPYMDPKSKGVFYGLTPHHHLGHLARAVMEGVVFSLRLGMEVFEGLGIQIKHVVASGGGTRHLLWLELLANIFGREVEVSEMPDASALGAAMLAGVGCGLYADIREACLPFQNSARKMIQPDARQVEHYERVFRKYQALYPAVRGLAVDA